MMDVNSKAGFYDTKSPKLLLHEWCQREKRPRPRYRPISTDGGLYKCKVSSPGRLVMCSCRPPSVSPAQSHNKACCVVYTAPAACSSRLLASGIVPRPYRFLPLPRCRPACPCAACPVAGCAAAPQEAGVG
jgi:hypothetical protein